MTVRIMWKPIKFLQRSTTSTPGNPVFQVVFTGMARLESITEEERNAQGIDIPTDIRKVQVHWTTGVRQLNFANIKHVEYENERYSIVDNEEGLEGKDRNYLMISLRRDSR